VSHSATNYLTKPQVLAAVRASMANPGYVWDGLDEDDRPLSRQEMQAGLAAMALKLEQLQGSEPKERVVSLTDQPVDKKALD
jgi:hypothetical protein